MPTFAELKQKAGKAKDATVTSMQNTRDRHSSVPMKKTNWNPYDGSGPPPPPAPRTNSWTKPQTPEPTYAPPPVRRGTSNLSTSSSQLPGSSPSPSPSPVLPSRGPPQINRSTRPDAAPSPALPGRSPAAPRTPSLPSRAPSFPSRAPAPSLPSRTPSYQAEPEIDWTKLSQKDKEVFFSWLDEFFERSYGIAPPAHR